MKDDLKSTHKLDVKVMVMMMMDKTYKYITVQDFLALVLARSIQGIKCNELMKIDFCG